MISTTRRYTGESNNKSAKPIGKAIPHEQSHSSTKLLEKPRFTAVTVADTQHVIVADIIKQYRQCAKNFCFISATENLKSCIVFNYMSKYCQGSRLAEAICQSSKILRNSKLKYRKIIQCLSIDISASKVTLLLGKNRNMINL